MMIDEKKPEPNWLHAALGKNGAPVPPAITSERIKNFLARSLLTPGDLTPLEVQELAASVIAHLVSIKRP